MRFRMTIMPREDGAAAGGLGGLTNAANGLSGNKGSVGGLTGGFGGGRTSSFVAGNSTPKIGGLPSLGGLASSLMGGKEGIIISPDEIRSVNLSISDYSVTSTSSSEANVTVTILGKLLSHIEETETGNNFSGMLGMNTLLDGFASEGMSSLTKGLSKGMQTLGKAFSSTLTSKLSGITSGLGIKKFGMTNLYDMNLENSKELAKWALSYGDKSDYRDIVLEIIINEGKSKTYILPDMYAKDYEENFDESNGNGYFTVHLKQKRYSERKIEIE